MSVTPCEAAKYIREWTPLLRRVVGDLRAAEVAAWHAPYDPRARQRLDDAWTGVESVTTGGAYILGIFADGLCPIPTAGNAIPTPSPTVTVVDLPE